MQVPFFYQPHLSENQSIITLSDDTHKHVVQVLRMKPNDAIHVTNGKGLLCKAILTNIDKKQSIAFIQTCIQTVLKKPKIAIGISLLKNASRLEWFAEKVTELGISDIYLLQCHRTEKHHFRLDRLNGILIAAMLQSQQTWLPNLHAPQAISNIIQQAQQPIKLMAHCNEANKLPIQKITTNNDVLILIGPEGDFTPDEIATAINHNFVEVSLGNTRLRTETAGIIAATILILNS